MYFFLKKKRTKVIHVLISFKVHSNYRWHKNKTNNRNKQMTIEKFIQPMMRVPNSPFSIMITFYLWNQSSHSDVRAISQKNISNCASIMFGAKNWKLRSCFKTLFSKRRKMTRNIFICSLQRAWNLEWKSCWTKWWIKLLS